MNNSVIYTIGHSNHTFEEFAQVLKSQDIQVIVDVRSIPASKYTPQFNKEPLTAALKRINVRYLTFAEEFGARRTDALDKNNNVDFEKVVLTSAFQHGVERLFDGLNQGFRISLMCSEANPLECHRFAMVSRYLYEHGIDVQHILTQKNEGAGYSVSLVSHLVLQNDMIKDYVHKKKIPMICPADMFGENEVTAEQQIVLAYRQKNKEIAYHYQQSENNQYL